jgi:hypothetical protein
MSLPLLVPAEPGTARYAALFFGEPGSVGPLHGRPARGDSTAIWSATYCGPRLVGYRPGSGSGIVSASHAAFCTARHDVSSAVVLVAECSIPVT